MAKGTKKERASYISSRANELARSGDFDNWRHIETHLRFVEGYPEARSQMDRDWWRKRLNRECELAQKRKELADA